MEKGFTLWERHVHEEEACQPFKRPNFVGGCVSLWEGVYPFGRSFTLWDRHVLLGGGMPRGKEFLGGRSLYVLVGEGVLLSRWKTRKELLQEVCPCESMRVVGSTSLLEDECVLPLLKELSTIKPFMVNVYPGFIPYFPVIVS